MILDCEFCRRWKQTVIVIVYYLLLHTIFLEGWKNHWYVSLWFESGSPDLPKLEY